MQNVPVQGWMNMVFGASQSDSDSDSDVPWCAAVHPCGSAKFHFVPKNGWHPSLREMGCDARNTIRWKGKGPIPAASESCWMLPTSDEMAICIAQLQGALLAAGWKLLTCAPGTVTRLSNKALLQKYASEVGLSSAMPESYRGPAEARYPCILKAAVGQHGKDVFIVESEAEVAEHAKSGFGSKWVLQELVSGREEYSASLLVDQGLIIDAILTVYEYDKEVYIWPYVEEVSRTFYDKISPNHLATMSRFLRDYSGICNFNYKVTPTGEMCIFEVNTRVGADLACDVPRYRARALFEKLDELSEGRIEN